MEDELDVPRMDPGWVGVALPDVRAIVVLQDPVRRDLAVGTRVVLARHRVRVHLAQVADGSVRVRAAGRAMLGLTVSAPQPRCGENEA